jgi:putative nucleotidyltransferase with HDIG domain
MRVRVIADTAGELSSLLASLASQHTVSCELLARAAQQHGDFDAVVVTADLRNLENISALKQLFANLTRIPRRLFLIEQNVRLSIAQAYALGATRVLPRAAPPAQLMAELSPVEVNKSESQVQTASMAGATTIASMFQAVLTGATVDVEGAIGAGRKIADSIAEQGLSDWLEHVRRHHEGTYQHCLLVTGVAVDFGLSLRLNQTDMERLYTAAMFHDVGKAAIPLSILDKPGRLDADERAMIETHPVAGYELLKGNAGISQEVLDAVRHHHEYLDGSGYPDALSGHRISDIVRLLTICDIFSALIEYRPYRSTMAREDAFAIVSGMDGKLEKPLVSAFKEVALTR